MGATAAQADLRQKCLHAGLRWEFERRLDWHACIAVCAGVTRKRPAVLGTAGLGRKT